MNNTKSWIKIVVQMKNATFNSNNLLRVFGWTLQKMPSFLFVHFLVKCLETSVQRYYFDFWQRNLLYFVKQILFLILNSISISRTFLHLHVFTMYQSMYCTIKFRFFLYLFDCDKKTIYDWKCIHQKVVVVVKKW